MIEVVAFDLDDTLWAVEPVIIRAEKILNGWLGENVPGLNASSNDLRALREEVVERDPGLVGRVTALRHAVLSEAIRRAGHSAPGSNQLADQAMEVFIAARNEIELFPGALETLEALSEKYVIGALSNGNADIRRLGLNHAISFHFSAEDVGAPKPEPDLFHAALEHTGRTPEQIVYVGDDPRLDVDAANRLGFRTVWTKYHDRKPPGETKPDEVVSDIRSLPEALVRISQSGRLPE